MPFCSDWQLISYEPRYLKFTVWMQLQRRTQDLQDYTSNQAHCKKLKSFISIDTVISPKVIVGGNFQPWEVFGCTEVTNNSLCISIPSFNASISCAYEQLLSREMGDKRKVLKYVLQR